MMKRIILSLFLMMVAQMMFGQRTPYTPFYRYNWQMVNPAALDRIFMLSNTKTMMVSASYFKQWVEVEGAPEFYHVSFEHKPVVDRYFKHRIKWGMQAFEDKTDAIGTVGVYGNFSYYIEFNNSRDRTLHFGISPGFLQYKVDVNEENFADPSDPSIGSFSDNRIYTDFNFGILYKHSRRFYVGASVPQTFTLDVTNKDGEGLFVGDRIRNMHFYFVMGGFISAQANPYSYTANNRWMVEPSLWVRYLPGYSYLTISDKTPISGNINVRLHYKINENSGGDLIWGGIGMSTGNTLHLEAGLYKVFVYTYNDEGNLIRLSLSYDVAMGKDAVNLGNSLGANIAFSW